MGRACLRWGDVRLQRADRALEEPASAGTAAAPRCIPIIPSLLTQVNFRCVPGLRDHVIKHP